MGKNGNERPMFCDASDGNGDSSSIQLPNNYISYTVFTDLLVGNWFG